MKAVSPFIVCGNRAGAGGIRTDSSTGRSQGAGVWMQVITYDPYVSDDVLKRANVRRVELDELIRTSDYISLHCPLTPETKHLFSARLSRR